MMGDPLAHGWVHFVTGLLALSLLAFVPTLLLFGALWLADRNRRGGNG